MAIRYKLDATDGTNLLKVFGYSTGAAILAIIISLIAKIDIPAQYMFIVPIVNILLVAVKDFFENRIVEKPPEPSE